jgi:hypothetical protein
MSQGLKRTHRFAATRYSQFYLLMALDRGAGASASLMASPKPANMIDANAAGEPSAARRSGRLISTARKPPAAFARRSDRRRTAKGWNSPFPTPMLGQT